MGAGRAPPRGARDGELFLPVILLGAGRGPLFLRVRDLLVHRVGVRPGTASVDGAAQAVPGAGVGGGVRGDGAPGAEAGVGWSGGREMRAGGVGRGAAHAGGEQDWGDAGGSGRRRAAGKRSVRGAGRLALRLERGGAQGVPGLRLRGDRRRRRRDGVQVEQAATSARAGGQESLPPDGGLLLSRPPP